MAGDSGFIENTVAIRRCSCVVKGGRRFSFAALIVVGDKNGRVGYGYGKGKEVPVAIEKATKKANRALFNVPLVEGTVPHEIVGRFGTSRVLLMPASAGTGIIAGGTVRSVLEAAGITDILTKVRGSTNSVNVVKATINALQTMRTRDGVATLRGVDIDEVDMSKTDAALAALSS